MNKLFQITLILLLIAGCTKESKVLRHKSAATIKNFNAKIANQEISLWETGIAKKAEVSKALVIGVKLPILKKDDAKYLFEKHRVNSWLLKINRMRNGRVTPVGYVAIPFFSVRTGQGRGWYKVEKVFVQIMYAAAYNSHRFRRFSCPAFEHNKKIGTVNIRYGNTYTNSISTGLPQPIGFDPDKPEIVPTKFNGGTTLVGEYTMEMALFNNEDKTINSQFLSIEGVVEVLNEETKALRGCEGVREELAPPRKKGIESFKFGG